MEPLICPYCHTTLPYNSYFCFNCGKKVHEPPISIWTEMKVYVYSILLPPIGFWYGYRYLTGKDSIKDPAGKRVGWVAIILTVVVCVFAVWGTISAVKSLTGALSTQMNQLNGGSSSGLGF